MRVVFLNRFFFPDHAPTSVLLSDLAFAVKQHSAEVMVITSRLRYDGSDTPLPRQENIQGIRIYRVWSSRYGRSRLLGRSLDYGSFYVAAAWRLFRLARNTDIVVTKTDPPLLSVIVAIVAKLRGAPTINWVQDIFPEVAEALGVGGIPGSLAFRLMKPLRDWSLRAATVNVLVGAKMMAYLETRGISAKRMRVISNWADGSLIRPIRPADNPLRKAWGLDDSFVVGYAGNLGRAHELDTLIDAMTVLEKQGSTSSAASSRPRIMFVFVGGGAQHARLEQEALRRGLLNVQIHPYQPQEILSETLGVADLHLVSLNPALEGLIVPSKFFSIAAAGRPIVYIGACDGEIARLINESDCGFAVSPGDGRALASRILRLARNSEACEKMGAQARATFVAHWDKKHAMEKWLDAIEIAAPNASASE